MTQRLLTSALIAGLVAGVFSAVLQFWLVSPLILEAELYESGEAVHFAGVAEASDHSHGADAGEADGHTEEADGHSHSHGDSEGGMSRNLLTFFMNLVTFCGFGLVLVAGMALAERAGRTVGQTGVIWGMAGFAAVMLAPSMGLAPELPGTPAPDVYARLTWWFGAVAASVIGLALLGFGRNIALYIAGAALIALPHLIGAPMLEHHAGVAPPELGALFSARTLAVGAASWAMLGAVAGWLWSRKG